MLQYLGLQEAFISSYQLSLLSTNSSSHNSLYDWHSCGCIGLNGICSVDSTVFPKLLLINHKETDHLNLFLNFKGKEIWTQQGKTTDLKSCNRQATEEEWNPRVFLFRHFLGCSYALIPSVPRYSLPSSQHSLIIKWKSDTLKSYTELSHFHHVQFFFSMPVHKFPQASVSVVFSKP